MVYNDPEVNNEYNIRAFVYVTSGSDKTNVLIDILNSLTQGDDNSIRQMNREELKKHIYQQLEGKQYLVVLDHVSDRRGWDMLKDAFPNNRDNRCRILITTQECDIHDIVSRTHPCSMHRVELLDRETSLELFRWRVFGKNDCPVELREYEKEIVMRCNGLPLAILAVAAMVVKQQKHVNGWKDVATSLKDYIAIYVKQTSYVHAQLYEQLPNYLKSCFVYLAVFPEEFEIPVWKLLRLWIAEGLIHNTGSFSYGDLEDIAEGYLDELADRNLMMVSKRRSNGKVGICRMHDMIYEFCKEVASREMLVPKKTWDSNFDRYCHIFTKNLEIFHPLLTNKPAKGMCTRSLLFFSREENMPAPEKVWCSQKTLKVLEAESLSFAHIPLRLCTLVLLKYLAISGCFKSLPEALFDLWSLQTLIVKTTCDTLEIKADVWKLPNFRHLHTNVPATFPCNSTKIQGVENSVRTLCWISPGSCKREVFDQTSELKKLGIREKLTKLLEAEGLFSYMHKFECLENLKLWNDDNLMSKLPGLPASGAFPKQLTKLTLSYTRLHWKEMRTLGEMENLEFLKLKEHAFVGQEWKTGRGGFLRLRHLHIGHTDLMVWEASADHFPVLRSLEISGCNSLQRVPHTLADIISLQSVRLHSSTSSGVTYSLKRIRLVKFLQTKQTDKWKVFEISVFPPQA